MAAASFLSISSVTSWRRSRYTSKVYAVSPQMAAFLDPSSVRTLYMEAPNPACPLQRGGFKSTFAPELRCSEAASSLPSFSAYKSQVRSPRVTFHNSPTRRRRFYSWISLLSPHHRVTDFLVHSDVLLTIWVNFSISIEGASST